MRTLKAFLAVLVLVGFSFGAVFADDGQLSQAPSPAQLKEFFSQIESDRITSGRLQEFLRGDKRLSSYALAQDILGYDSFITPEEVTKAHGPSYTGAQLKHFADTLPSEDVLRWCQNNNYALVAGPPVPLGLLEIQFPNVKISHRDTHDKAITKWLVISKEPVQNSTNKNWDEQLRLLSKDERVANAAEMGWFITTFYWARGVRLFDNNSVRTSDITWDGLRVEVGFWNNGSGVMSNYRSAGARHPNVGLAAARKL